MQKKSDDISQDIINSNNDKTISYDIKILKNKNLIYKHDFKKGVYEIFNDNYKNWYIDKKYDLIDDKILWKNSKYSKKYKLTTRKYFIDKIIKYGNTKCFLEYQSIYETIRISKCSLFIDFDIDNLDKKLNKIINEDIINDIYYKIIDKLEEIFDENNECDKNYMNCYNYSLRTNNKGEKYTKLSIHIVNQNIYFNSAVDIKYFLKEKCFKVIYKNIDINHDESIYKKFGCFRTCYCIKDESNIDIGTILDKYIYDDDNITKDKIIEKMLITKIDKNAKLILCKNNYSNYLKINEDILNEDDDNIDEVKNNFHPYFKKDDVILYNIIDILNPSRSINRSEWLNVLYSLQNEDIKYSVYFSKKCMEKYNGMEVQKIHDNISENPKKISIATLFYMAKNDNYQKYMDIFKKIKYIRTDPYCYNDFSNDYNGRDYNELKYNMLRDLRRVYFHVECDSSDVLKIDCMDNFICFTSKELNDFCMFQNNKKINFKKIYKENMLCMPIYKSIGILSNDEKIFNIDFEYVAKVIKDPIYDNIFPIIELIKKGWCNINENNNDNSMIDIYNYLMGWFYKLFFGPEEKTKIALFIFSSKQGVGKNSLTSFIREMLGNYL